MIHQGIRCPKCLDIIYSRAVHDFHSCTCGSIFVDGGFGYLRYGPMTDGIDWKELEVVDLNLQPTEHELYNDWNYCIDKYGTIKQSNK